MVGTSLQGSKRSDGPYEILKGCGNGGSTHNVFGLWITKSEIQCCFRFLSFIFKTMKIARVHLNRRVSAFPVHEKLVK